MKMSVVMTSINKEPKNINLWSDKYDVFVAGDVKSTKWSNKVAFITIEEQKKRWHALDKKIKHNHYARKNFAYLAAIEAGADIIFDTDDDNFPIDEFSLVLDAINNNEEHISPNADSLWQNIPSLFYQTPIRPRGWPLHKSICPPVNYTKTVKKADVWQFAVCGDPDIDAIDRLAYPQKRYETKKHPPVILSGFCPFNSQATLFYKDSFQYLYMPNTWSMRACDIIRGYAAQAFLLIGFAECAIYQKRNIHDYTNDLRDEIVLYQHAEAIAEKCSTSKDLISSYDRISQYNNNQNEAIICEEWIKTLKI